MKKQTFKIGSSADMAHELKRTLELQLLYVSGLFSPSPGDPGEAIHEARRSYKRCRAILRLMRDAMGYATYYRENARFREMQRDLSRARDADVQYHLIHQLAKRYPEFGRKDWFKRITDHAKMIYEAEMRSFVKLGKAAEIAAYNRTRAAQIQQYELSGEGFEIIEGGLSRIYRQGREMGKMIFSQDADPNEIHAFRKKAKYLQYQLTYLRSVSRVLFRAMSTTLEQLTENLGYYNDLHIATTTIREYAGELELSQKQLGVVSDRLGEEMQHANGKSAKYYELSYVEKPTQFIERIRHYWESYEKQFL